MGLKKENAKNVNLDLRDKKVLYHLIRNSRMPFTQIAKKVKMPKESVQYRFHRLLEKNVILRTYADVDYEMLGFQKFHLLLLLNETKKKRHKELLETIQKHSQTLRILEFSDAWDFEVVFLASGMREFYDLVHNLLGPFEDVVLRKDIEAVIDVHTSHSFPQIATLGFRRTISPTLSSTKKLGVAKYDDIDLKILAQLSKNTRISTYALAPKVGLSADAVGLRIKKLQESRIIKSFTCHLNLALLNYHGYVFSFNTTVLGESEERKLLSFLFENPYVISTKNMIGSWDLKNYVVVQTPTEFHHLVRNIKNHFSSVVQRYETWVVHQEIYLNPFPQVLLGSLVEV